jgi:predicted DNA-binding mobile mystery protein A
VARDYSQLKLKQVEELLQPLRPLARAQVPRGGWVRAVREALGMTAAQLAARVHVTRQSVRDLEHSEATGKITLESLNKLAAALGCRVVYALVPEKPLDEMQRERARQIADSLVKPVAHSMRLEAQSVSEREEKRQRDEIVRKLLEGDPRKLWD